MDVFDLRRAIEQGGLTSCAIGAIYALPEARAIVMAAIAIAYASPV
jgi:hypothetical protein